jgi:kinesin family member 5
MGRSLLIEDGALPWIVKNANSEAAPIRRHIELALCHLAQHGILISSFLPNACFIIPVI